MSNDRGATLRDVLTRLYWMMLGPLLLALLAYVVIKTGNGWLTGADIGFLAVLAGLLLARWLEFRGGNDTTRALVKGDFEYTAETKANAADTIAENRDLLLLAGQTLPIGGGAGGLVLLIIGIVLTATGGPRKTADAPADTPTATTVG